MSKWQMEKGSMVHGLRRFPLRTGKISIRAQGLYRCLFVVVGFTLNNGAGTIQLLNHDKAHHLMAERHF